jgi:hypothetical protein
MLARHLEQTYHMRYGGLERMDATIFRLPYGDPATIRTEPPAVLLRELAAAARAGTAVRVPKMGKPDRTRFSELLRQSRDRAAREPQWGGDVVALRLAAMCREWDDRYGVPPSEYERAEYVALRTI